MSLERVQGIEVRKNRAKLWEKFWVIPEHVQEIEVWKKLEKMYVVW